VLKGSHKLSRLEHGIFAGQAGIDPTKLEPCFDKFELIHCELDKGDVLFTHFNLLHSSAANTSND
jgi:ectoine hydroxylase-related dioxygenase (phytanoyl-CoA dioxygenase family)